MDILIFIVLIAILALVGAVVGGIFAIYSRME